MTESDTRIEVEIIGDHPHSGKRGYTTGKLIRVLGVLMAEVQFPDGSACFAEQRHIARRTARRAHRAAVKAKERR